MDFKVESLIERHELSVPILKGTPSMGTVHQSIVSYADTTIGAVFFNVTPLNYDVVRESIISAALKRKESADARREYIMQLTWYVDTYHRSLKTHEWCHILQALVYPGLYLRCIRELNLVESILTTYRNKTEPSIPIRMWLTSEWQTTLAAPIQLYRMIINELGDLHISLGNPEDRRSNDLSENDLLEEDASIFQYKVEIGGLGSGRGYRQWLREQRRYTMTFNFLARLLGPENAYLALPALVHAAFSTTFAMGTFGQLVALTIQTDRDLPSKKGFENYKIFLQGALASSTLGFRVPDPGQPVSKDPASLLNAQAMYRLIQANPNHPLHPLAHDIWVQRKEEGRLSEYMIHPYRAFDRRKGTVSEFLMAYLPPLTVIRLLDPTLSLWDAVIIVAPRFADKLWPRMPELTYTEYLYELLGRRYLAFALVTDLYDNIPHNCHHIECPYYPTNLCRRWFIIPKEYQKCEFPMRMEIASYHHLDPKASVLRPRNMKGDNHA